MEYIQEKDETIELSRDRIYLLLGTSVVIDLLSTGITLPAWIATLGGGIVIEEVFEAYISKFLSKHIANIKLDAIDYAIGALPIPGVTAVSVKCLRLLLKR